MPGLQPLPPVLENGVSVRGLPAAGQPVKDIAHHSGGDQHNAADQQSLYPKGRPAYLFIFQPGKAERQLNFPLLGQRRRKVRLEQGINLAQNPGDRHHAVCQQLSQVYNN